MALSPHEPINGVALGIAIAVVVVVLLLLCS